MSRRWMWALIALLCVAGAIAYPGLGQSASDAMATGYGYVTMGWLPEAVRQFQLAARQHPHDPETLLMAGIAYQAMGRAQHALSFVDRAAKVIGEGSPELWALMGEMHLSAGQINRAEAAFQRALSHDDQLALAYRGLAAIAEQQGERALARERYEAALALAPTLFRERLQLARLLLDEQGWEEALEHLQLAARIRPRDADVQWLLAQAYLGLEEQDRAVHALTRALQLNPEHAPASALLESLSDTPL